MQIKEGGAGGVDECWSNSSAPKQKKLNYKKTLY